MAFVDIGMPEALMDFATQLANANTKQPPLTPNPIADNKTTQRAERAPGNDTGIGTIPSSAILNQDPAAAQIDPALAMLQNESAALSEQAITKSEKAVETARNIDTQLQVKDHLANTKFNEELLNLVGPDRIIVQRLPKGNRTISSSPGVETTVDPKSGEVLVHVPQKFFQESAQVQQNDTKIMAQIVENTANPQTKFNVESELAKVNRLTGEARADGISKLLVNIDMELAKAYQRIRQQAAIESGYQEAQASLMKNIQMDTATGFTARFNQASAQTQAAQRLLNTSLAASQSLEASLVKADTEVARLIGAKNSILKVQAKNELKEAKKDDIADTVTQAELTNYHIIEGSSGDDRQDKLTIAARRDKDPVLKKLLKFDTTNMYALLSDPSADVRAKALKIVNEYDRAANGLAEGTQTPTFKMLKKYIDDPSKIIDDAPIPNPDKAKLRTQLAQASGKELESLKQGLQVNYLASIVQEHFVQSYGNMKGWKGDDVTSGPLKEAIDKVSKTNPTGAAPIQSVIDTFMSMEIPGPDGKDLDHRERAKILDRALKSAVANELKSVLLTDPDAVRLKVAAKIDTAVAKATFLKVLGADILTGLFPPLYFARQVADRFQ